MPTSEIDTRSEIQQIFDEINSLDTAPQVFKVFIECGHAFEGYTCCVSFYGGHESKLSGFETHAYTPELAAQVALKTLKEKYTRCPQCGNYLQPGASNARTPMP
jgi:hypothetical protein